MIRMCEKCQRDEYEVEFEGNSKSILCKQCFYNMFKDLIPGLKEPILETISTKDYKDNVIYETKDWKKRRERVRYSLLDGYWATIFIHLFDERYERY